MTNDGLLVVISGAAGTGKGTVVERLAADEGIRVSISATTRSPRGNEQDGREYHFLTKERFRELIENDGFLEFAEYVGNFYGSPRRRADSGREAPKLRSRYMRVLQGQGRSFLLLRTMIIVSLMTILTNVLTG